MMPPKISDGMSYPPPPPDWPTAQTGSLWPANAQLPRAEQQTPEIICRKLSQS